MGNYTDAERPVPPKPAFVSMPHAVAAAIQHGNTLADIMLPRWAATYCTSEEAIRQAWEAELTRQSQIPSNIYDSEGK
jgi:hypothetical protein